MVDHGHIMAPPGEPRKASRRARAWRLPRRRRPPETRPPAPVGGTRRPASADVRGPATHKAAPGAAIGSLGARRRLGLPLGVLVRTRRPDARVVHAPGGALAPGVPARRGARTASSRRCATRSSPPSSPANRCAATASMPRSSSPTSWSRTPRSAAASTIVPGRAPSWIRRSAPSPTSNACARSNLGPTRPTSSRRSAASSSPSPSPSSASPGRRSRSRATSSKGDPPVTSSGPRH